jgi:hypothetical protein
MGCRNTVTETFLVSFSIGKIDTDVVLCDVVEMDSCHMILGRPWQFDVDAQHKVRENIYVFFRNGQKMVLRPMQDVEPLSRQPTYEDKFGYGRDGAKLRK